MAGMVGSRQGGARRSMPNARPRPGDRRHPPVERRGRAPVAIVPGVMVRSPDRDGDVIRGETQIVGLLAAERSSTASSSPGTKWATVTVARSPSDLPHRRDVRPPVAPVLSPPFGRGGTAGTELGLALGVERTVVDGLPFLAAIFGPRPPALDGVVPF
jgi:hypothetical protein